MSELHRGGFEAGDLSERAYVDANEGEGAAVAMGNDEWLLIVDDDRNACDALAEILRDEGFQVTTAGDGDAALEALRERAFVLVITDLQMPHMDGLQLLHEMRERSVSARSIVMSARGTEAAQRQAKLLGALGFLFKPVDLEELLALVQQAVAGRSAIR